MKKVYILTKLTLFIILNNLIALEVLGAVSSLENYSNTKLSDIAETTEYGRIGVCSPAFTVGHSRRIVDRSDFYRGIAAEACKRRDRILKKENKIDNGSRANIATFAIEFFDSDGVSILEKPVFFGHSVEENLYFLEKIKTPHFFLSGRHTKEHIEKDVSSLGLSVRSPTEVFKKLKDAGDKSKDRDVKQSISNFRHYFLSVLPFEKTWFNNLMYRSKASSKDAFDGVLKCPMEGSAGYCMVKLEDEGIFLHSEQLALALMQDEESADNLLNLMNNIQKYKNIKNSVVVVFHIYTFNTMCARCSRSIYWDFRLKNIEKNNLTAFFGKHIHTRFIIAATEKYTKTVHRKKYREPESSTTSPNDSQYSGVMPIPFLENIKENDYLYQWIITPAQSQSFFSVFYDIRVIVPIIMFSVSLLSTNYLN